MTFSLVTKAPRARKLYSDFFELPLSAKSEHKFINKTLAHKVLKALDSFTPVPEVYYQTPSGSVKKFNKNYLGLTNNNHYCEEHRAFFVENSAELFSKMHLIMDIRNFVRQKAIGSSGIDLMLEAGQTDKNQTNVTLNPAANLFFTTISMYTRKNLGQHFSCLTQTSNHIPGNRILSTKDFAAKAAKNYQENLANKPECLSSHKLFPKTWDLQEERECSQFFAQIDSPQYQKEKQQKGIVYIRKTGSGAHRGAGVEPVNDKEENLLRTKYANGTKCGLVAENFIIQQYIHNPLLIEGRKFDFRMYMLLASTNPLLAYYHDGFLRVSIIDYNVSSNDKRSLLTNLILNKLLYKSIKDGNLYKGMNKEGLRRAQQWSFEALQEYLLREKIIHDENWLDNYLRPEMKKAMIHLIKMAKDNLLKSSSVYELYGVDFMLDRDLNLWFIEANAGPSFDGYSKPMEKFIVKMLADHFEIVHGLLKSRMKRIVVFVNKMILENLVNENGEIKDLMVRRKEFEKVIMNRFEKEFEPKITNGFSKIIDENLGGVEVYSGLVSSQCL